jgi:Ankyrin repeats (3 copies)
VQQFALFDYATQYWAYYTAGIKDPSIRYLALDFLGHGLKGESASQALFATNYGAWQSSRFPPEKFYGIHLASYLGLKDFVRLLIQAGANPDSKDSYGLTPLSWAASRGYAEVVKLLLVTPSIEPNSKDSGDTVERHSSGLLLMGMLR